MREQGHSVAHMAKVFSTNNYNVGLLLKGDISEEYASLLIGIELGKSGLDLVEFRKECLEFLMRTHRFRKTQEAFKYWTDATNRERVSLTREVLTGRELRIATEIERSRKLQGS
jgi:hypothetical protein